MIASVRQMLSRLWRAVTGLLRPAWRFVTRGGGSVRSWVVSFVHGVRERHVHRMDTDGTYPVAIAAGSTAVAGVLAASPAIAAAIGVLVTQLLGVHDRHGQPRSRPSAYGRRPWEDDRESARLWERNDWDEG